MHGRFVEVTNGFNWGKFMVARFGAEEWEYPSVVHSGRPLLSRGCGWNPDEPWTWVLDLQTGEGAYLRLGGHVPADLERHAVHVCPMYEPFLVWLYEHAKGNPDNWWETLPALVHLPEAESSFYGYRRPGTARPVG